MSTGDPSAPPPPPLSPTSAPLAPVAHLLQFFSYGEMLDPKAREIGRVFHDLAHQMANNIAPNPELTVALRKLLEAKDAALRARGCR